MLISRRFDIPWEAGLFAAADQPVLVYTSLDAGSAPDVAAPVEVVRLERVHARPPRWPTCAHAACARC